MSGKFYMHTCLMITLMLTWAVLAPFTHAEETPPPEEIFQRAPGHLFEVGEIRAGNYETAPYLPEKIRFELTKQLRLRGLLAAPSAPGKTLTVRIETVAYYSTVARYEHYDELESQVRVIRRDGQGILAAKVFREYNGWGEVTSDFTEMSHAKEIADFLENIVR
jgi:hypothetical protein